jgi:NEDD4-binding protein 2
MKIMRGVPGSGKTTWARKNRPEAVIVSADDYFICSDGVYRFEPCEIADAHARCFRLALRAVQAGHDVVVDNTGTQTWEMSPYVLLARAYGFDVEFIRIDCDPREAARRNVHGVPEHAVMAMHARMEDILPFWGEEIVIRTSDREPIDTREQL